MGIQWQLCYWTQAYSSQETEPSRTTMSSLLNKGCQPSHKASISCQLLSTFPAQNAHRFADHQTLKISGVQKKRVLAAGSFCSFGRSLPNVRKIKVKLRPCLFSSPWYQVTRPFLKLQFKSSHCSSHSDLSHLKSSMTIQTSQASQEVKKGWQKLHGCTGQTSIFGNLAALHRLRQHEPLLQQI